jgi:hypothetical protein
MVSNGKNFFCKEEYLDCEFPAFNPRKMIERQAKVVSETQWVWVDPPISETGIETGIVGPPNPRQYSARRYFAARSLNPH